ncbi:MAG: DUF2971 domain-containing protein [Burkholderiaceae bacterium]
MLLHILQNKFITLRPPSNWDDQNDKELMRSYSEAKNNKTCLALCFAQAAETYHHWKIFSPGYDGACIVFNKNELIHKADHENIRHGSVKYLSLEKIKKNEPTLEDFPFSKRSAYRDEKEYRFLFESIDDELEEKIIPIDRETINRIIINPWMHESLFTSTAKMISSISSFEATTVRQSTIISSRQWKALANDYTAR